MFYTIQNDIILTAEKQEALTAYYTNVLPLPEDYEVGKYIVEDNKLVINQNYDKEKVEKERERIAKLSMTKREMFLGLYKSKGITPDNLKKQIVDPTALIEFEYANDYYRGNPLIDIIGAQLGFTTEQLDKFFETKDYTYLLPIEDTTVEGGEE